MAKKDVVRIGLVGATGRMGRAVCALLEHHTHLQLTRVLIHRSPVPMPLECLATRDPEALVVDSDVVIDFSAPPFAATLAKLCSAHRRPLLVASTQLSEADNLALAEASCHTPVLTAANLSVGIAVLSELVATAAARLPDCDIEVMELHHRRKRDAPSGTAELLMTSIEKARPTLQKRTDRMTTPGPRQASSLGIQALRGGDVAGEHTVFFLGDGERIEITHRATGGLLFAQGALRAALWLYGRDAGPYTMTDVLRH